MLIFRDTDEKFELEGELLKMIIEKNFKVDLPKIPDEKPMCIFAKEMHFDENVLGSKSTSDKSNTRLLESPAIMASGISTKLLPEITNKLCDRSTILLQGNRLVKILTYMLKKSLQ